MLIYTFKLKKAIWLMLIPFVIILILILGSIGEKAIGAFSIDRELPIYSVERDKKVASITFDCAWGADDIYDILDVLKKEDVKATFFIVGQWAEKYTDKVKAIALEGHDIANHSYSHLRMGDLNHEKLKFEILEANKRLSEISGTPIKLFRAPYGEYNNNLISTARNLGLKSIQWNVDSLDWKPEISKEEIMGRVLRNVSPGSILLFHNDTRHTAEILPEIIKNLKQKGYSFLPVSELILKENYYIDFDGKQKTKK